MENLSIRHKKNYWMLFYKNTKGVRIDEDKGKNQRKIETEME